MTHMLSICVIFIVIVVIAAVLKALTRKGETQADYPYQKEPFLFSPAERSFLGVLEQAVGDQFRIMGKVRLADVIGVKAGMDGPARQKAFNRIQSKHLDFVACDPNDFSVQFAVELDDKSHDRKDRQERDAFLDAATKQAGVPVIRFTAKAGYTVQAVWKTLASRLNASGSAGVAEGTQSVGLPPAVATTVDEPKPCPSCGGDMVRRKASRGQNAGQEFWGCSNYPKCRSILPI